MYTLARDVMGGQMPQTLVWPTHILEPLYHEVKVLKLTQQVATTLMVTIATTLAPADGDTMPAEEYDEIATCYSMYV
jgi:hypothetical protein